LFLAKTICFDITAAGGETSPLCDTSDRPQYVRPPEKTVNPIISEEEIQEAQLKKDNLVFDIATVVCDHS
jgi:hypothetical protein